MSSIQPSNSLIPTSYTPVTRNIGVFNTLEQAKSFETEEVKSAADFFAKEIAENKPIKSYMDGYKRYKDEVFGSLKHLLTTVAMVTGLTVGQTMFRKNRARVESLFLLAFLAYPVSAAVNALPKMIDAYKLARSGEPSKGKAQFSQAFNESIYQIFHNYIKPFTISTALLFPLLNPAYIIKHTGKIGRSAFGKKVIKFLQWGGKKLGKNPKDIARNMLAKSQKLETKTEAFLEKNSFIQKWDKPAARLEKLGSDSLAWFESTFIGKKITKH